MTDTATAAAQFIQERHPGFRPRVGLILGSGLGALADEVLDTVRIPYHEIPGFPRSTVEGHEGCLILGRLGGMPVACMQGRVHLYEGVPARDILTPIRCLKLLDCEFLLATNAAGSLRAEVGPGRVMMITDHINMTGRNPLVGPNDDAFGPRFPGMDDAYDGQLRAIMKSAAEAVQVDLAEGVYLACLGPSFETPAEIRAFKVLGADAVGMSTVPEVIAARHAGLRVAALSVITNLAAGMSEEPLSHDQTLAAASKAARDVERLAVAFLTGLKLSLIRAHMEEQE